MKKSYKDWLDLDVDTIEPIKLSDTKKALLKNNILTYPRKKKFKRLRQLATAAIIGISAVTATSFAFPAIASQMPFMQNIISYFNDKDTIYEDFENFSTEVGQMQTSNGVSVLIENAVFDGTSLSISYAVETDIDLGPNPSVENGYFQIVDTYGAGSTGMLQKVSGTTYAGIETITPFFNKVAPNEITVAWQPTAFTNEATNTKVEGDWQFDFTLQKLDGRRHPVNQSVTNHGVTVAINSFEKNEMSTVIHYEQFVDPTILKQWPFVSVEFDTVQDDLGNTYIVSGNGGKSTDDGLSYKWSDTIKSVDPNAKSLTLVPTVYFSLGSGHNLETKKMDQIIIDLR